MAVAFRSASSWISTGGATSQTPAPAVPTGATTNDLMVAFLSFRGGSGTTLTMTGWTLALRVDDSTVEGLGVYWKAFAGESGSYSFSASNAGNIQVACVVYAISGAELTTPIDATSSAVTSVAATSHVIAACSPTHANCLLLSAIAGGASGTNTPDGAMTEPTNGDATSTGTANENLGTAYQSISATGTTGTRTVTTSASERAAYGLVAIAPPLGDVLTTGSITVGAKTPYMQVLTASWTVANSGDEVVTFDYSTNGSSWTTARASDVSDIVYDLVSATRTAKIWITQQIPNTAYYYRATYANPNGTISGTNPVFVGGGSTPGTTTTTLTKADRNAGSEPFANARASYNWIRHDNTTSNLGATDFTSMAKQRYVVTTLPDSITDGVASGGNIWYEDQLDNALVTAGHSEKLVYSIMIQVFAGGGAEPQAVVQRRNGLCFDNTATTAFAASFSENWFLHKDNGSGTGSTNRLKVNGSPDEYYLDPGRAGVQVFMRQQYKRMMEIWFSDAAESNFGFRYHGITLDNVFLLRPNDGTDTPVEYATDAAWRAVVTPWLDIIRNFGPNDATLGFPLSGNVLSNRQNKTLIAGYADHLRGSWYETYWTAQDQGGVPSYQTAVTWETDVTNIQTMLADTSSAWFAGRVFIMTPQIPIASGSSTATWLADAKVLRSAEFITASWMLTTDVARTRVFFRLSNASAYGNVRFLDASPSTMWTLNTGAPTDTTMTRATNGGTFANTTDADSTAAHKGIYYRRFANGILFLNVWDPTGANDESPTPTANTNIAQWTTTRNSDGSGGNVASGLLNPMEWVFIASGAISFANLERRHRGRSRGVW